MTDDEPPSSPLPTPAPSPEVDAVLAANQAFYDAFEAADLDAMSAVWEHSDRAVCTHPGWPTLRGWGRVAGSWFSLFGGPQRLQFILTDPVAEVLGDTAMVTVSENLLDGSRGSTVAALNVFVRGERGDWRMIAHHGSPVAGS